jgi:hypothetical protein
VSTHLHADNEIMEYLERLLIEDRSRLLRIISYLKQRIFEEEAKCEMEDVLKKVRK